MSETPASEPSPRDTPSGVETPARTPLLEFTLQRANQAPGVPGTLKRELQPCEPPASAAGHTWLPLDEMSVLGVCGFSGSGKTTLLEQALPAVLAQGLRVAVLKHDVHGLAGDDAAKDSGRLFRAGADVIVHAPGRQVIRQHRAGDPDLPGLGLDALVLRYDLVLIEGYKHLPVRKVWLCRHQGDAPPASVKNVAAVLPWDARRMEAFAPIAADVVQHIVPRRGRWTPEAAYSAFSRLDMA